MSVNYTKGDELMLFINDAPVALATAHTLSLSTDEIDVANKDAGFYGATISGKRSWELSSDAFYTYNGIASTDLNGGSRPASSNGYKTFFDLWESGQEVPVKWTNAYNYDIKGISEYGGTPGMWTPQSSYWSGKARVTSLELTANTGEIASFSATLTGQGALSYFS